MTDRIFQKDVNVKNQIEIFGVSVRLEPQVLAIVEEWQSLTALQKIDATAIMTANNYTFKEDVG